MSLENAIRDIAALAPKSSGHLIRHTDWNALIKALGEFGKTVRAHDDELEDVRESIDDLGVQLGEVAAKVLALGSRMDDLEASIDPLLQSYVVKMSCERVNFAMGELCVLTAEVTDLRGRPITGPRPWVDFIAAWGRLRAQAGFNSRAGAADNSISVQVNTQGIARVVLRAEHSEGFSESQESQISAIMGMQVTGGATIANAILNAATPTDTPAKRAYSVLKTEYERSDSIALRSYADTYHLRTPQWKITPAFPGFFNQWTDYRATVMAMAKPDADPTTPDGARGSASIQVTFRDWIGPWAVDYLDDDPVFVGTIVDTFVPMFELENPYAAFDGKINADIVSKGILGRRKYVDALGKAAQLINPGPQVSKQIAKSVLQQAAFAQSAVEVHGGYKAGNAQGGSAFIGSSVLAQASNTGTLGLAVQEASQAAQQVSTLSTTVELIENRLSNAETLSRDVRNGLNDIKANVNSISVMDPATLAAAVTRTNTRVEQLATQFFLLEDR